MSLEKNIYWTYFETMYILSTLHIFQGYAHIFFSYDVLRCFYDNTVAIIILLYFKKLSKARVDLCECGFYISSYNYFVCFPVYTISITLKYPLNEDYTYVNFSKNILWQNFEHIITTKKNTLSLDAST